VHIPVAYNSRQGEFSLCATTFSVHAGRVVSAVYMYAYAGSSNRLFINDTGKIKLACNACFKQHRFVYGVQFICKPRIQYKLSLIQMHAANYIGSAASAGWKVTLSDPI